MELVYQDFAIEQAKTLLQGDFFKDFPVVDVKHISPGMVRLWFWEDLKKEVV